MKKTLMVIIILMSVMFGSDVLAAGSFVVNGGQTSIKFIYSADTSTVLNVCTDAAHKLWGGSDDTLFNSMTNQEKLNIIDFFIRRTILDLAQQYNNDIQILNFVSSVTIQSQQTYTMQ
jgi:hypothetical protein